MSAPTTSAWLRGQRKADLIGLAQKVGLQEFDGLKKDLEVTIEEHLNENADKFSNDPSLAPFYQSKTRSAGSPVKREAPELKVPKRRQTKASTEEIVAATDDEEPSSTSTALATRTPARALSIARRLPLPATPADVAQAVDRGTLAVRQRVTSAYVDSGIPEATQATRDALSTVSSVILAVAAFEAFYLRSEVLPNRYAFTIPAISALGTNPHPISLPDVFVFVTSSFWIPSLLWLATSTLVPSFFGYFFNLHAAAAGGSGSHGSAGVATRGRPRGIASSHIDYAVDPLTFSVVKGVLTYVVYAQGVTFGGLIDPVAVARINSALYGGWKGAIVGSFITGLMAVYDAVLRK